MLDTREIAPSDPKLKNQGYLMDNINYLVNGILSGDGTN